MQILPITQPYENLPAGVPKPGVADGRPPSPPRIALTAPDEEPDRFLETTYRDGTFSKSILTLQKVLACPDEDVDLYLDEVTGRASIRPQRSQLLRYQAGIPGIGQKVGRPFLDEVMWQPGEVLDVAALLRNPALKSFESSSVRATWMRKVRIALHESELEPWFIELFKNPWRIKWCERRSWRLIEKLAAGVRMAANGAAA